MTTFLSPRLLHFARIYSHSMSLEHCIICQHRSGHITASTLQQCSWHAYMLHCIQRPMCRQTPHRRRRLPRPSGISAAAEDRHQWRKTGCGAHTPVARSTSCTVVRRHCSTTPCHPAMLSLSLTIMAAGDTPPCKSIVDAFHLVFWDFTAFRLPGERNVSHQKSGSSPPG